MGTAMKNPEQIEIGPVLIANVEQLYSWSNDGGISAGSSGAGFSLRALTPKRIVHFDAPVSLEENFDFEQSDSNFPVLIELRNRTFCERTFLSFEDVRAIHFREENARESYERFPTPSFGMSEVALLVSPDLFCGNPGIEPIKVEQQDFDNEKFRRLDVLCGSILLIMSARQTDSLGSTFTQALCEESSEDLPELLQVIVAYRWGRPVPESEIGKFVYAILDYMFENLDNYRSIESENSAVQWTHRLRELTEKLESPNLVVGKPPSERFGGMESVLTSSSTLKELSDASNSFRTIQYAVLIALMRRDTKSFVHWLQTSTENTEEVRLTAAFLLGFRCSRRLILDRKIRTPLRDKVLTRVISESLLSNSVPILLPIPSGFVEPIEPRSRKLSSVPESVGITNSGSERTITISGADLVGIDLQNSLNGKFTLTIRASSLELQVVPQVSEPADLVSDPKPKVPKSSGRPKKTEDSSDKPKTLRAPAKSPSGRAKIGSMAEPSETLFSDDVDSPPKD